MRAEPVPEEKKFSLGKPSQKQILLTLGIMILLGALYYFRSLFVVAIVNGRPITRLSLIRDLEARQGKEALDSLVTEKLIFQEADRHKIKITQEELEQELKKIEESFRQQGQELKALLSAQGLTKSGLLKQIKMQKIIMKMFADKVKVSDEEIEQSLEKNKDFLPKDAKPEELREQVREQLRQQKISEEFQTWLEETKKNAKIYYFLPI